MVQQQIKPALEKLKSDADIDVQFYAAEAMDGWYSFEMCSSYSFS